MKHNESDEVMCIDFVLVFVTIHINFFRQCLSLWVLEWELERLFPGVLAVRTEVQLPACYHARDFCR
ncbi:hypothetical protein XSR1_270008 [Xenorhabdus szentirmaii DSM 16338]|uniref:Transposase n=1 Tax=Xenorhabdus szentirmaii DSM 16338 TaxID=1427518 RepID=W1IYS8_9GAMM|nr:hypothetical protein XSR1_270008 [Xenorhabdus szentirmaii DSM 16338]